MVFWRKFYILSTKGLKDTKCLEGSLIVLGILGTEAKESSSGSRIVPRSAGRIILFW